MYVQWKFPSFEKKSTWLIFIITLFEFELIYLVLYMCHSQLSISIKDLRMKRSLVKIVEIIEVCYQNGERVSKNDISSQRLKGVSN